MSLTPQQLRRLFATGAVIAVLISAVFYVRSILNSRSVAKILLKNIPANLDKQGKGFTFSQSAGQKTLFTIHAAGFQQYKDGGKAELSDVSIVVYGREENSSDQIYGSKFSYDPTSGDVTAEGEVHIDLDATTPAGTLPSSAATPASNSANPAPETKTLIHLKTSGLTFNQKSGIATTNQRIEFRVPEASGSATGANYDSHDGLLVLKSGVKIVTTDKNKATITGESATISKDPRQVVLRQARVDQPPRIISTDKLTVLIGENNNVSRLIGSGNVHATAQGPKGFDLVAPQGELLMAAANQLHSGSLTGGVNYESRGDTPAKGTAGKVLLNFGPKGRVSKVRMEDSVDMTQGPEGKSQQIMAKAVDLFLVDGKRLEKAITSDGPAQVAMARLASGKTTTTTVGAGKFVAAFNEANRLSSLIGSGDARLVSSTPGQPDRVATGHDLRAGFNDKGELSTAELIGDLHYDEGTRTATADRGRYNSNDDTLVLNGSPRIVDNGLTITADTVDLSRKSGNAVATGNVKTTYRDLKPQASTSSSALGGGLFGGSEPIHVTGSSATASKGAGTAKYTAARMWQGENIVEAPSLTFDKTRRSLQAQGSPDGRVTSVVLMPGKNGKSGPANITSDRLSYVDSDRKAVFSGKVLVKGEDFTLAADSAQVLLLPRTAGGENAAGNQLDRIVAQGDIQIQQTGRKASGSKLIYTGNDQKFVLSGGPGHLPSIFDAEHGKITGDSLTFFSHDGRVLVGSGETPHTLTQNGMRDASKK